MLKTMKFRVALREEGEFWNAYMAHADSMDNAKLIGSIAIGAVRQSPEIKAAFMDVMKQTFALAVEKVTGNPPVAWEEHKAPGHERQQ